MKLFASIENERGKLVSKGGNEFLSIDLAVGNDSLISLMLRHSDDLPEEEGSGWVLYDGSDNPIAWIAD